MRKFFCRLLSTLLIIALIFSGAFVINRFHKLEKPLVLNVGSYNLMHGIKADFDMSKIADNITSTGLDIVGLQEVNQRTARVNGMDMMKELSEECGYPYYAFFKTMPLQGGEYGIGILSKYPILSTKTIMLESGDKEQRVLGYAEIDVDGQIINFFVTHLSYESKVIRDGQFEQIADELDNYEDFILVGDFNTSDFNSYDVIEDADMVNDHDENIITFPESNISIDNIVFSDENWEFTSPECITEQSYSDHYMIYATGTYQGERDFEFSDVWQDMCEFIVQ